MPFKGATKDENSTPTWPPPSRGRNKISPPRWEGLGEGAIFMGVLCKSVVKQVSGEERFSGVGSFAARCVVL